MASSSSAIETSCSSSENGCWMRWRRATTVGCSADTQKRNVETTCLRRERSSRYNASITADTDPNMARNCPRVRFSRCIQL